MKPSVSPAVSYLAGILRNDIAPNLTGFTAGNAGMMAAMLDMVAEEWDRAAARLVAENAAMRGVLAQGAAFLPGPAEDAAAADPDLRISALEAENERLAERLIALHTVVEESDSSDARLLDDAIWAVLRDQVEGRRISLANF